jgi:hypothetical protein
MLTLLSALFFLAGLVSAYIGVVRPILRQRGYFADFYARSDSFWRAAADYVRGLRGARHHRRDHRNGRGLVRCGRPLDREGGAHPEAVT